MNEVVNQLENVPFEDIRREYLSRKKKAQGDKDFERMIEIVQRLADGLLIKQIASELNPKISVRTVEALVINYKILYEATTLANLCVIVMRLGFIK